MSYHYLQRAALLDFATHRRRWVASLLTLRCFALPAHDVQAKITPKIHDRANGVCTVHTRISVSTAQLHDAAAMADFLKSIPNSAELAKVLQTREAVASRAYDDETWTARFVASDGQVVKCFAVSDITIDQAEMIAAAGIDLLACDEAGFREAVARALGPTLDAAE